MAARRQDQPVWRQAHNGQVPAGAVEIGRSGHNGEMMYVGRAKICGDLVCGKVVPSHHCCYVGCNMKEKGESVYEVLTNQGNCHLEWVRAHEGQVPAGAIEAGRVLSTGEPLYVGRAAPPQEPHGVHGGKVHPSHGCLYMPYGGTEIACRQYEVLCNKFIFA